jgi:hypothetical protein
MGSVDEFIDSLDDIKEKAAAGPGAIMDEVKGKFDEFKGKVQNAIDNPSSLVPSGGAMAAAATWYGNAVAGKLKALMSLIEDLIKQLMDMASAVAEPMKNVGEVIGKAMATLEKSLKKLSKLPAEVGKMAAEIDSPDDIAKIDVEPMKACLKVDGIESPLNDMGGLKGGIEKAIEMVKDGMKALMEFCQNAGDHIKDAFAVPFPCCCCTSIAMSNAPQAFTEMMGLVDKLKDVKLGALQDLLGKTGKAVGNIDVAAIKLPVSRFAESAGDSVGKLEKTVQGAKLASNPAGALGGFKSPF